MTMSACAWPGSTAASAPRGLRKATANASLVSLAASSTVVTVTRCRRAAPGAKFSVPPSAEPLMKSAASAPAYATYHSTLKVSATAGPTKRTSKLAAAPSSKVASPPGCSATAK